MCFVKTVEYTVFKISSSLTKKKKMVLPCQSKQYKNNTINNNITL